jgi:hypothetical protein
MNQRFGNRMNWIVFTVVLAGFCLQQFFLFAYYIPDAVTYFDDFPSIQEHIRSSLWGVWQWMLMWPLALLGLFLWDCMRGEQ